MNISCKKILIFKKKEKKNKGKDLTWNEANVICWRNMKDEIEFIEANPHVIWEIYSRSSAFFFT
jgi:hypothetical protein